MAVTGRDRPAWLPRRSALLAWTLWALAILGHVPILWFDFNRRRHDAARTISAFNDRLRQHVDLNTLTSY
jgi:hypothetical protein